MSCLIDYGLLDMPSDSFLLLPIPLWLNFLRNMERHTPNLMYLVPTLSSHHAFIFQVFNLVEFDRVLFLDADTMVLSNVDHLFDLKMPENGLLATSDHPFHFWFSAV